MSCCICGTVRNCGKYLDKIFQNMELIGGLFQDYVIIIYYDESNDNTLQKLNEYKKRNNRLIIHVNNEPMSEFRTHRIAKGRNLILDIIRRDYVSYPYFIMMDCDDRCAKNIKNNLLKYYLNRPDWDSLSFNHPDGYYDTWALSIRPFVASCHHFEKNNIQNGQRYINYLIKRTPKYKLISCLSAFNGFAIYRTDKFLNCRYDGRFRLDYIPKQLLLENVKASGPIRLQNNEQDCEHRHFHFEAVFKNGAKNMISPLCLFH
jgi:hypothetical protein